MVTGSRMEVMKRLFFHAGGPLSLRDGEVSAFRSQKLV